MTDDLTNDLGRLKDLCAGDGERIDLLEAGFLLSVLGGGASTDLAPFRQHVTAMTDDLADLVHRRGATPVEAAGAARRSDGAGDVGQGRQIGQGAHGVAVAVA